jgi:hypothetical protein
VPAVRYRRLTKTTPHHIAGFDPPSRGADPELDAVEDAIRAFPFTQELIAEVLRDTYDQLYDGQHTGRYRPAELLKTEKTHMGTIVEINMQRTFQWADGDKMDYEIAGADVDCKFSQDLGGWAIPIEARAGNHICLVIWADEQTSRWEAGLIRVANEARLFNLEAAGNRDGKRELTAEGESQIRWLYPGTEYPENQLLHLDDATREAIFTARTGNRKSSGQARINMLFRLVQRRIVSRGTVLTVAQQDDGMKRPRDGRKKLKPEGILVLGHQEDDPLVAAALGLPVPRKGQFISIRVARAEASFSGPVAEIEGVPWREARSTDPVVAAPDMPRSRQRSDDE